MFTSLGERAKRRSTSWEREVGLSWYGALKDWERIHG